MDLGGDGRLVVKGEREGCEVEKLERCVVCAGRFGEGGLDDGMDEIGDLGVATGLTRGTEDYGDFDRDVFGHGGVRRSSWGKLKFSGGANRGRCGRFDKFRDVLAVQIE